MSSTLQQSTQRWKPQCIYQILTDRFAFSDEDHPKAPSTGRMYLGGTWRGIARKLDYIQDLGCTAIWISPIVKNIEDVTGYGQGYHGYWAQDLLDVNPHFGTKQDLIDLVQQVHDRNMLCMVDIVVNHMAHAGSGEIDYSKYRPFKSEADYHPRRYVQNYDDTIDCETGWLGDDTVGLLDIRTEEPRVQAFFQDWIRDLVQTYHFDGLRIDTVKHVHREFYPPFIEASKVFTFGEVFHGDPRYVGDYLQYMPSSINYPLYYQIRKAFAQLPRISMKEFYDKAVLEARAYIPDTTILGNFIENHDVPRILSMTSDSSLLLNTLVALMYLDGIPIVFQGQEQMFVGGDDPENRNALWSSHYDTTHFMFSVLSKMIHVRQSLIRKFPEFCNTLSRCLYLDNHNYVFERPGCIVCLCNGGSNSVFKFPVTVSVEQGSVARFMDIWTEEIFEAAPSSPSTLNLIVDAGLPKVLVHLSSIPR
ncbi:alpha-amylase-like protein [Schizosaccharomyces osmophilus]|uniref:Alpha-amylase-like protein n=1 Tax=Schizosaccharomyces osmophilus TaxID=2545709 RepID=A0AAE9WFB9_9SCHI|nr:alpha-amylase-like protein [Schizosaccharomyces osmophilus]WBW74845.1 alpha-amylase-like protein [Schizosaccharomyces osmophilus]